MFIDKISEKQITNFLQEAGNLQIIDVKKTTNNFTVKTCSTDNQKEIYFVSDFCVDSLKKVKGFARITQKLGQTQDQQKTIQWRKFLSETLGDEYSTALKHFVKVQQQNESIKNAITQEQPLI